MSRTVGQGKRKRKRIRRHAVEHAGEHAGEHIEHVAEHVGPFRRMLQVNVMDPRHQRETYSCSSTPEKCPACAAEGGVEDTDESWVTLAVLDVSEKLEEREKLE